MTGATAGAASRFAGIATSETRAKCSAISGAVARLAASVTAAASASGRGSRRAGAESRRRGTARRIARTAAKDICQPGSRAARGSRASVAAAARPSAYQREAGRPAIAATIPAAPMIPARWIAGPAPASGT